MGKYKKTYLYILWWVCIVVWVNYEFFLLMDITMEIMCMRKKAVGGSFLRNIFTSELSKDFSSVQLLSCVRLFVHQASLSITNFRSSSNPVSIELVMPSNHLILCHPLLLPPSIFPSIRIFPNEFFASGGQSIGASASASVLPMNTQDWPPLGWTGWTSLQSKGLSRVFSNTTVQKHQFFSA